MNEALMRAARRIPGTAIGSWPVWSLPGSLTGFVLTVIALDLAAIGTAACLTTITRHDLLLFGLLLGCTALAVELSRKTASRAA